jgi:hypothetical protein
VTHWRPPIGDLSATEKVPKPPTNLVQRENGELRPQVLSRFQRPRGLFDISAC